MLLKNRTFIAFTVKLLFCFTGAQAQTVTDSATQKAIRFLPVQSTISFVKQPVLFKQLSANFYAKQLPFFCNKELQVQKAFGFPIKFRLGSVEYSDKLEGKNK